MRQLSRVLLVVALLAVAGCTTASVTDSASPTGAVGTPTAGTDGLTPLPTGTDGSALGDFEPAQTVEVAVTRVVDGDTVDVRFPDGSEDTVRLVGIDSPEVHVENDPGEYEGVPDSTAGARCLRRAGQDASEYASGRLDGATVTLAFDPRTDRRGGYDRLLAYVYRDGTNLNHELVATGHARVYETDFAFRDAFERSEAEARESARGLWACRAGNRGRSPEENVERDQNTREHHERAEENERVPEEHGRENGDD